MSDDEEAVEGEQFYSGEFLENSNFDSDSDSDYFRDIHIVTEEELIRRRRDKIRKLLKLYKAQFKVNTFKVHGFTQHLVTILEK